MITQLSMQKVKNGCFRFANNRQTGVHRNGWNSQILFRFNSQGRLMHKTVLEQMSNCC